MNKEFKQDPYDIIIVGAGITGLQSAITLRRKGLSVLLIEARDRTGGRIHTLGSSQFSRPVEAGAEFIHGSAPMIQKLLKKASVKLATTESNAWEIYHGKLRPAEMFSPHLEKILQALRKLRHDMTMSQFLEQNFSGREHDELREDVRLMVQGFDAADVEKISAFSLRDEWSDENEFSGHRPVGGYSQVIDMLTHSAQEEGVQLVLSSPVKEVRWKRNKAEVLSKLGQFEGSKVLITVPAAVLKAGHIRFVPSLPNHEAAFQKIATGGVVKFLFEFKDRSWEIADSGFRQLPNLGFVFSDAPVRTWWTQDGASPVLTGWLAGPDTDALADSGGLEKMAIDSLAYIFNCKGELIKHSLRAHLIIDWVHDEYALGAYAYKTPDTKNVLKLISTPVEDTIYFAGEAFADGKEMGTVEAALVSAESVSKKIMNR